MIPITFWFNLINVNLIQIGNYQSFENKYSEAGMMLTSKNWTINLWKNKKKRKAGLKFSATLKIAGYGKKDLFPEDKRGLICYYWQNSEMKDLSVEEEIW